MAASPNNLQERLVSFARQRRRWLIGAAVTIVIYTLSGFFLAPWLVKNAAINAVADNLNAELRLAKVAINPYVLSLRVDGLELDAADGEPVARVQQIYTNFQLSSLFRWAWSFAEVRFDKPELFLARNGAGALNVASLPRATDTGETSASPESEAPEATAQSGMPRLYIFDFAINGASVDWRDAFPPEPVETILGPVSVRIAELNTLPDRSGQQEVVIATETQGTMSWSGSLQLNPLNSSGRAAIKGSHFPLSSAYLRHRTGVDITDGVADIELDYSIVTDSGGNLSAAIDNLAIAFTNIRATTFHTVESESKQPREFLSVPRISLSGGELRWPEQTFSATNVEIGDAALDLVRLNDGAFDFANTANSDTADPEGDNEAAEYDSQGEPWALALDRFAIVNFDVSLTDASVTPTAETGLNGVTLEVLSINNADGSVFPTTLSMTGMHGGAIRLDGSVIALPQPQLDFAVSVGGVSLAAAHPYLKPLADVNLDSGTLSLDGRLRHDVEEPLSFSSDITIADFLITETDEGTKLGSWDTLLAEGVELSVANNALDISEVRLDQGYGDILIAADGSVNLGRVSRTAPDTSDDEPQPEATADSPSSAPMTVTIGRVIIDNAAADFADASLPLPFAAKIEAMSGTMSTISTASAEPSNVSLEGQVDEYGLVRVSGFVTPLDVPENTDLAVVFENIEVPKFSAYTIPFAGREIASGRLDLDLGYRLEDRKLAGENNIVLRDFELGEKVEHPGAASLPLGLAVALLKDPSGKIDIDLPVRGDLDDPEFGYGRVIGAAIVNLIVKIVASPFALLGNLVGAEADELEYINFPAGRSDLTPPEIERAEKIAEALSLRPELILEISGVIDREADGLAIREVRIDSLIESRIEAESADDDANYTDLRAEIIESMFRETLSDDDDTLEMLRTENTAIVIDEAGKETQQFDELAFTESLRRRLVEAEVVTDAEMIALARSRATNTTNAVLSANPELGERIQTVDLREEDTRRSDDTVRMRISLATQ